MPVIRNWGSTCIWVAQKRDWRSRAIASRGDREEGRLKRRICVVVASEMTVRAFLVRQLPRCNPSTT